MTPPPRWSRIKLRPQARGPLLALITAIDNLNADGRTTPCQADPEPFTSDSRAERAEAAKACADCWVRRECLTYAQSQREKHGVLGGKDRVPRTRQPREPAGDR